MTSEIFNDQKLTTFKPEAKIIMETFSNLYYQENLNPFNTQGAFKHIKEAHCVATTEISES